VEEEEEEAEAVVEGGEVAVEDQVRLCQALCHITWPMVFSANEFNKCGIMNDNEWTFLSLPAHDSIDKELMNILDESSRHQRNNEHERGTQCVLLWFIDYMYFTTWKTIIVYVCIVSSALLSLWANHAHTKTRKRTHLLSRCLNTAQRVLGCAIKFPSQTDSGA
jgi:hypothetical protein